MEFKRKEREAKSYDWKVGAGSSLSINAPTHDCGGNLQCNAQRIVSFLYLELMRCRRAGTIFHWGGVKIMRATFRGVHKSVINDNKDTVLDLVSEYNIITM